MLLSTRLLFCFAGIVALSQSIPLGNVRRNRDVDIESEDTDNPFQDLIQDAMKQIEGNVLRQLTSQTDFLDQGLTGSQTVFSGTNTAFNGARPVLLPTQSVVAVPSNNNNFGSAFVGSIIGSSIASIIPLLLRPAVAARLALLSRGGLSDYDGQYFDEFVNPPGSKVAYLYPDHALQSAENANDDVYEARGATFRLRSIPYHGTKTRKENIKAPSRKLEIRDSLLRKLKEDYDNEAYDDFIYTQ